jgi:predicted nucleotidyltransferase component of viral defense system
MRSGESIKALIRNISKEKNIAAQELLRRYMLERLLERISLSEYKNNFVLKGGLLIASIVGIEKRTTLDVDTTLKNIQLTEESIQNIFETIINIPIDDGIEISISSISEIRETAEYPGLRLKLLCKMGKTSIKIKVDLSTGDKIIPQEVIYKYNLLLENRSIDIFAYQLETILAEKLETTCSRGTTNTRMRDFYDLYTLMKLKKDSLNIELLKKSIVTTSTQRGSIESIKNSVSIIDEIFKDSTMKSFWETYQNEYHYAKNISWNSDIKNSIIEFIHLIDFKSL